MPKRKCAFTNDLKREYPYLKETVNDKVHCNQCMAVFSISHSGRSDINKHLQTQKHKSSIEAAASLSHVINFFKPANSDSDGSLKLAAKEATFAYHTAIHGQSFKISNCTSKLISKSFEIKFALARTKCKAVIVNCIPLMVAGDLRKELGKANFITMTIDASKRKEIKLVLVVVHYFVPDIGVKIKLLEFKSFPGETTEILSNYLVSILEQNELKKKVVGFCTDNRNTNFGGVKR